VRPRLFINRQDINRQDIEEWLVAHIASAQRIHPEQVDVGESFVANGLTSASSVALVGDLSKMLGVTLPETLTWDYGTIDALAEHVAGVVERLKEGSPA
jgi:acyl carrier protein